MEYTVLYCEMTTGGKSSMLIFISKSYQEKTIRVKTTFDICHPIYEMVIVTHIAHIKERTNAQGAHCTVILT